MTLHIVQLELRASGLARFAHLHGVPDEDEGYLLHRLLRDAFGPLAPQPFRFFPPERRRLGCTQPAKRKPGCLLGYAEAGEDRLRDALALAEPAIDAALPGAAVAAKAMPQRFSRGTALGFEVRACPIVRTRRGDGRPGSRELDVFLHESLNAPREAPLSRERAYARWLEERLAAGGAGSASLHVHRMDQAPLVRRRHPGRGARAAGETDGPPRRLQATRDGRRVMARRPDVTFRGTLRVDDPEAFARLLATGVGRHRAFGFGMLLLRPAAAA